MVVPEFLGPLTPSWPHLAGTLPHPLDPGPREFRGAGGPDLKYFLKMSRRGRFYFSRLTMRDPIFFALATMLGVEPQLGSGAHPLGPPTPPARDHEFLWNSGPGHGTGHRTGDHEKLVSRRQAS